MNHTRFLAILSVLLMTCALRPAGQPRHGHGGPTLFLVEASGRNVRPATGSTATATGAFTVDPGQRTVAYDLTYHGLSGSGPRSIALHNFGAGGTGDRVFTLCGEGSTPCPSQTSANLTGSWSKDGQAAFDTKLLGEFASARIYLEIVSGDGKPAIRGQLEPNGAMVPVKNYVAHLAPIRVGGEGVGTAVLSEIHHADGRVEVFYRVTVAGTSGVPQAVSLAGVAEGTAREAATKFSKANALPGQRALTVAGAGGGGTLVGTYNSRVSDARLATRMLSAGKTEVGITVSTGRFPDGELYGAFKPVN